MRIQRLSLVLALAVCVAYLSGCALMETQQDIQSVKQHPTEDVTLIQTIQTPPGEAVYWYCTHEGGDLVCNPTCGQDIACPEQAGLVRADRSPAAQQGAVGGAPVADEPVDDEPDVAEEDDDADDESEFAEEDDEDIEEVETHDPDGDEPEEEDQ